MTSEQIAASIAPDSTLAADTALALPLAIVSAIGQRVRAGQLTGLRQHTILELGPAPFYDQELAGRYSGISWFSSGKARAAVNGGWADVMPAYFREVPKLLAQWVDIDYMLVCVSPMENGVFSCGCTCGAIETLRKRARHIYLEVNPHMPFVPTSPLFRLEEIAGLCHSHHPLPTLSPSPPDPVSTAIGSHIVQRIPDGATIQLGIGAIPDAVGRALREKRHLGLHTELFTDSMVELLQCGAADNSRKPIHKGKTVATFAYGSQTMYDYLHHNSDIALLPVDYVNDPATIARHPNFVSINSALEVDFFGQVCAESVGTRHISGTGGQVDYVQGANLSPGGQSFIAFPSTAQAGTVSRIQPILAPGAVVTTSKNDVDCIVTEYGVAKLRGQTLKHRVQALISIAHPQFREELTYQAKRRQLLL